MGILDLFKGGGDTIKGTIEGVGTLATDVREAITGEGHDLSMEELRVKTLELANAVDLAIVNVTALEAQGNWFQRSWRPGLAWVIIGVIFVQYLLHPVLAWIDPAILAPVMNSADLWPIILGLIGYRSYEKTQHLTS